MGTEITTLTEHRKHMEELAVLLNGLVKDTDDEKIKQEVKSFLADVSQVYRVLVIGGEKTGRTTVLRNCFAESREQTIVKEETVGICELRYGAQEITMQVEEGYSRRFVTDSKLEGLALFDVGSRDIYKTETAHRLAAGADVIIAVFSPNNIQDDYVWDFIEKSALGKRVVCVLTKVDLYPADVIEQKKKKLFGYMQELKLATPVFAVSDSNDAQEGYEAVRKYIRNNIIGTDPAEQKRQNNFERMIKLQRDVKTSIEKRCRQFETDNQILLVMDKRIKSFYDVQEEQIANLKDEVVKVIQEEVANYQNSIIKQFDPKELKRNPNTANKKTFMEWLQHEVERYEHILNNRVDEKTRKVMRQYISEIDDVCTELQELLESRDTVLEENDLFFGTIARSKSTIINRTTQVTEQTHGEYLTLMNASEELFDKVWKARRKYDLQTTSTTAVTTVAAGVAGAVTLGLTVGVASAVVAALVLGTAGYEAGKLLAEQFFDGKLTDNTQKYIEEFKQKITDTREEMERQVMGKLDELFENEFHSLDRNFLQFRTATNIDAKNVPLLESRLQEMESFMERLMREEKDYEYVRNSRGAASLSEYARR